MNNSSHVLTVSMGEIIGYRMTCNLDDTAPCHQVCSTHPDGGCMDNDHEPCRMEVYSGGCVIAEYVNDGGIESVEFNHIIELPVEARWNRLGFPKIYVVSDNGTGDETTDI